MNKITLESIGPHAIAIVVFALVTIFYFKPVFFDHKSLSQPDIQQWEGGAKELLDYRAQTGNEALWTNSMFGGMPGYLITTRWGFSILSAVQKVISLGLPHPVRIVFLSFISFYILLLVYGVRPYLAIAGALAFGLSSFNIIGLAAGHNARITAIAYMPLVLAGIHLTYTRSKLNGFALTALALALELNANHLQITYYLLLIVVAYAITMFVSAFRSNQLKPFLINSSVLLGAALLAFGTFAGSFFSTLQYSRYSMRGTSELQVDANSGRTGLKKDYAFQYSNGIFEPMTLFIPYILGGSSREKLDVDSNVAKAFLRQGAPRAQIEQQLQAIPTYWGNQTNTAPYYAGAMTFFLFVLGIMIVERRTVFWVVAIVILGIVLSWGSNFSSFNYAVFDFFPGYNKFRSVTFTIIMSIFAMNLLGFLGLEKILQNGISKENTRKLLTALGVTGGLALLLIVFAGIFSFKGAVDAQLPEWFINPLRADREHLLRADAFRSLIFIMLAAGLLWASLSQKIKYGLFSFLVIMLVLIDMWTIDKRYLKEDNFARNPSRTFFSQTDADREVLKDRNKDYRVFNLVNPWSEARTSYFHKSIGGYHGAKIRRYQDLVDQCLDNERAELIADLRSGQFSPEKLGVLNMMNVRYFLAGRNKNEVIYNTSANGNAWIVSNIQKVSSAQEELSAVCAIDTKTEAIIDINNFPESTGLQGGKGQIILNIYKPNYLKYAANIVEEGVAVFSEIYYPLGWIAKIDGIESPILRANYVLRALSLPVGDHVVEFFFEPKVYKFGNNVTIASSILLLLVVLGTLGWHIALFIKKE